MSNHKPEVRWREQRRRRIATIILGIDELLEDTKDFDEETWLVDCQLALIKSYNVGLHPPVSIQRIRELRLRRRERDKTRERKPRTRKAVA